VLKLATIGRRRTLTEAGSRLRGLRVLLVGTFYTRDARIISGHRRQWRSLYA